MENEAYVSTKAFLESKPACAQALKNLKKGSEILVLLEGRTPCALFYEGQQVQLEKRAAQNPDVCFDVYPEAIRRLSQHPGDNMTDLGIEILREIVAGSIKISVVGSPTRIISNGYLKIMVDAGPDFLPFIKDRGYASISAIINLIKAKKKSN